MAGLRTKVNSVKMHATGKAVPVNQDEFRVQCTGLPAEAPDEPVTTLAFECGSTPMQDNLYVRKQRPRGGV